jgi:hypothetical protein
MTIEEAASLAIDHLIADGLSDITHEKIEVELIKKYRNKFHADVVAKLKCDNIYDMEFKPIQYLLTPKNRYVFDYRKAAMINPSCLAKFTALVFLYANAVELARIPKSQGIVFSYRFNPKDGHIFDKEVNYSAWREKTKSLAESGAFKFIVSCDIAAFYDRINIHRIESTLLSIGVDQKLASKTNDLLLFWSKKDSYGIPVGNLASRILAEAALIDIDQYLLSEGIVFTRYVDDYRLFAPDLLAAQKWMNKLTIRLFRDGLMLNTGKTSINEVKNDIETEASTSESKDGAEKVLKVMTKITGGYNRIVRKFVMPAEDKLKDFIPIDIDAELKNIEDIKMVDFVGIQKVAIAALVQKKFSKLAEIAKACYKYLYGLDYFIDLLIRNKEFIPESDRNNIADFYAELVQGSGFYSLEWHGATIARLLSTKEYFRRNALFYLIRSPGKDVSTYASIMALEGLDEKITRSEFRTIREFFDRCDEWEKRRIIWLSRSLPDEERKSWAKAIKSTITNDILSKSLIDDIVKDKKEPKQVNPPNNPLPPAPPRCNTDPSGR